MARFPVVYVEETAQVGDKTRIDGSASYVSGANAITKIEARPNRNAAWSDVTNESDPSLQCLDWGHAFEFEVSDSFHLLEWVDSTGQNRLGGISSDDYDQMDPEALGSALQEAINALSGNPDTFTFTYDDRTRVMLIETDNPVKLLFESGENFEGSVMGQLGLKEETAAKRSRSGTIDAMVVHPGIRITNADAPLDADPATTGTTVVEAETRVIHEDADNLFSTDSKLRSHEADILKYLPVGRATFKDVHRRAKTLILAWLDTQGFLDNLNEKLTASSLTDKEEFAEWATMMALRLIFESVRNATDDVFSEKAKKYEGLEEFYQNRATVKVDLDGDGEADPVTERLDIHSCVAVRR